MLARVTFADRPCRGDAVLAGQSDVHQHDIGIVLLDQSHDLVAVGCTTDDDEPSVALEDVHDERGELLIVLADDDPEWCLQHEAGACHTDP